MQSLDNDTDREDLSASLEDYLEAIYHLVNDNEAARSKDIAARLQVNTSSVTAALRSLAARELINYAPYDVVTLTRRGQRVARGIVTRHRTLKTFFTKVLALPPEVAERGACGMEHAMPTEIVERLREFADSLETNRVARVRWTAADGFEFLPRNAPAADRRRS